MRVPAPLFLAALLSACSAAQAVEPSRATPSTSPGGADDAQARTDPPIARPASCAGWAAETKVSVEDTTRGAALVFSTAGDIAALRSRVAEQLASFGPAEDAHLDNVHQGIRIVFESRDDKPSGLRESVTQRGRELTKTCGLDWNTRDEEKAKQASKAPTIALPEPSSTQKPTAADDSKKPKDDAKPEDDAKKPKDDAKKPKEKKPGAAKPGPAKPGDPKPPADGDKPKDPPAMPPPPPLPPKL